MDFEIPKPVNISNEQKTSIQSRYRRVKDDPFLVGCVAIVWRSTTFNHKSGKTVDLINCVGRVVAIQGNGEQERVSMRLDDDGFNFKVRPSKVYYGLATDDHTLLPALGRTGALMAHHKLANGEQVDALSSGKIKSYKMDGLFVTIHFGHLNSGRGANVEVPGAVVAVLAPEDAAKGHGRMVKLRADFRGRKRNDLGRVIAVDDTLWKVDVEFLDGKVEKDVKSPNFEFGALCGDVTVRPNKTIVPGKAKQRTFDNTTKHDYLAKHAFQLLRDIYITCADKLPGINMTELALFKTDEQAWEIADGFSEGVKLASPALHSDVYQRKAFDWADVLRNGTPFDKDDSHKGVVYGRGASKFPSSSKWKDTAFYTGETTRTLADRDSAHRTAIDTQKLPNSVHYQAMKDAQKYLVVFLFKLPRRWENLSLERKEKLLHICEQLTVLMLKTYHSKVLGDTKISNNLTNIMDLELFLSSTWIMRNQATSLTAVAEESFKATGWPNVGKSNLSPTGQGEGLNVASPLVVLGGHTRDRTVWSRTYHPSAHRTVFTRGAGTTFHQADSAIHVLTVTAGNNIAYETGATEAARYGPAIGTAFTAIQVEIMDPDSPAESESQRGLHPMSFFSTPEATMSHNQRRRVLSIGIKIFWKEGGKHYWRYVTESNGQWQITDIKTSLKNALVLRNFLMHETITNKPNYIPDPGFARVIEVKVDVLRQEALIRPFVANPPVTYEILTDTQASADLMRAAGLQRVDAPWPGPNFFTGAKLEVERHKAVAQQKRKWDPHLERTSCDFCFVSAYVRPRVGTPVCTRVEGTNKCEACTKAKIVCSWTETVDLVGLDILNLASRTGESKKVRGDTIEHAVEQSTDPKWAPLKRTMNLFTLRATDVRVELAKPQILPEGVTLTIYTEDDDGPGAE